LLVASSASEAAQGKSQSKSNLNPSYKIGLQLKTRFLATPNLVSKQIVWLNVHFSHNMQKARLSTANAIIFKIVLGEFRPSLTDSDRHKQLGTKLSIDFKWKYVSLAVLIKTRSQYGSNTESQLSKEYYIGLKHH